MRNLSCALLLLASVAFVVMGCSDSPNPVDAPSDLLNSPSTLVKMGDILHSATGSAHWRVVGSQTRVRCLFSAIQHKDGTFSGEFQNNDVGPTFKCHATVHDLMVEGNTAKMCFTFSEGSRWLPGPGQPYVDISGWIGCMVVVDNGQGKNAVEPDRVSYVWFDPPGTHYETFTPPLTIEQVHGLGITDFIDYVNVNFGMPYEVFVSPIDQGSVEVR